MTLSNKRSEQYICGEHRNGVNVQQLHVIGDGVSGFLPCRDLLVKYLSKISTFRETNMFVMMFRLEKAYHV